ncbi:MAG: hypothetical protein ACPG7F_06000 [Aggregatilineales bacterium]
MSATDKFEKSINNVIIPALNSYRMSSNFQSSINDALDCGNVDTWISQEQVRVGTSGAIEMLIPGSALLTGGATMVAGITYLFHHLARISWGCGALMDAIPNEDEELSDILNILTVWSVGTYSRMKELESRAIDIGVVTYFATEEGKKHGDELIHKATVDGNVQLKNTLLLAKKYSGSLENIASASVRKLTTSAAARGVVSRVGVNYLASETSKKMATNLGNKTISKPIGKGVSKTVSKSASRSTGRAVSKSAGRVVGKAVGRRLAVRLAGSIGSRFVINFIPLAGAAINAYLNVNTLNSMKDISIEYYGDRLMRDELDTL